MKRVLKKKLILGVAALFISLAFTPMAMGDSTDKASATTIEYVAVNGDGTFEQQSISLSGQELVNLIFQLRQIIDFLKTHHGDWNIIESLFKSHPLLQKLLSYLLSSDVLGNKKIVASFGLGRNLNPFKNLKTSIVRPFTLWHYSNAVLPQLPIPSTTVIVDMNPFKISTFEGAQIGFMLRFHGVYIYIPRPLPEQSITVFIGTASYVGAVDFPQIPIQGS